MTLDEQVEQSIFTWYLWEQHGQKPEQGAVVVQKPHRDATDLPSLSLLPPGAQRRSLTCVTNNVDLLVAIIREAEQGISRADLISTIREEAPYLGSGSANIIISQAQGGLGLISLAEGGVYRPTERGVELLTAPKAAHVLRTPLINRVFGMGHLLLIVGQNPGIGYSELASRLRDLVPSWKSLRPGSELIQWAVATELVRPEPGVTTRLFLTEDGEDHVAALPENFETTWRFADTAEAGGEATPTSLAADAAPVTSTTDDSPEPYAVDSILQEGCFLPQAEVEAALALLRRKKNLVLQGPPGTGKTWLAKRLGYALLGVHDLSRVTAVQFQPSLSYEDFVRGWRPDGEGGLRLTDGAFLEVVDAALERPHQDYVLVIEEINRGNPAQIFGELLTLLEADKRHAGEALRLAYPKPETPDERVHVPPNLYVIGTMNLADRSLALVDRPCEDGSGLRPCSRS